MASTIAACSAGTATLTCGRASAVIEPGHGQARRAASGAWRRQPGRRGTTEAAVAGAANAAALRRRRRSVADVGGGEQRQERASPSSSSGRLEAHGRLPSRRPPPACERRAASTAPAPAAPRARRRARASPPRRISSAGLARAPVLDRGRDVVGRASTRLAADGDDDVARAHAGLRGRAARRDAADHGAAARLGRGDAEVGAPDRLAALAAAGSRRARCWRARRSRCPTLPLPLPPVAIWELTPITRPLASSSGPPELPGLIGASVWMTESIWKPSGASMWRPVPDTMPAVAVWGSPNGRADGHGELARPHRARVRELQRAQRRRSAPCRPSSTARSEEVSTPRDPSPSRCGRRRTGPRRSTRRRRRARWSPACRPRRPRSRCRCRSPCARTRRSGSPRRRWRPRRPPAWRRRRWRPARAATRRASRPGAPVSTRPRPSAPAADERGGDEAAGQRGAEAAAGAGRGRSGRRAARVAAVGAGPGSGTRARRPSVGSPSSQRRGSVMDGSVRPPRVSSAIRARAALRRP